MPAPVHVPNERTTTGRPHFGLLLLLRFGANGRNPMAVNWYLLLTRVELVQEDPAVLCLPRLQLLLSDGRGVFIVVEERLFSRNLDAGRHEVQTLVQSWPQLELPSACVADPASAMVPKTSHC